MVIGRDFMVFGVVVAIASFAGMAAFGSRGFCGTPNMPYALGIVGGLGFVALGLAICAIQWVWRRTRPHN